MVGRLKTSDRLRRIQRIREMTVMGYTDVDIMLVENMSKRQLQKYKQEMYSEFEREITSGEAIRRWHISSVATLDEIEKFIRILEEQCEGLEGEAKIKNVRDRMKFIRLQIKIAKQLGLLPLIHRQQDAQSASREQQGTY